MSRLAASVPPSDGHSQFHRWRVIGLGFGIALLTGCNPDSVRVYEIPKEKNPPMESASASEAGTQGGPMSMPELPSLKWDSLPAGWSERSSGKSRMRTATFGITDTQGHSGELAVVGLPGMRDDDLEFINMWRTQIQLPPITTVQLPEHVEPATIAGLKGKLFSIGTTAAARNSNITNAIQVAVVIREGVSWFFKMSGDVPLVANQRASFLSFLQGVRFEAPPAGAGPFAGAGGGVGAPVGAGGSAAAGSGAGPELPKWEVPKSWQAGAPGPMVMARFTAVGDNESKADITITSFPGDVGGLLANVNRWRNQVKLAPLSESQLSQEIKKVQLKEGEGTMVSVAGTDSKTGKPARLVGVVVPRDGKTWFYKMMGSPELAERETPAFLQFVQSAQYASHP